MSGIERYDEVLGAFDARASRGTSPLGRDGR